IALGHQFPERLKLDLSDEFVISSNPGLLSAPTTPAATFLRANGNNIRNSAAIQGVTELTPLLKLDTSYKNNIYRYDDKGHAGSYSSELDRIEHVADVNLMYTWDPTTVLRVGYKFEDHDQTSKDPLGFVGVVPISAKVRDSQSHYGYVGADWTVSDEVSVKPRAGVEYTRYPNALGLSKDTISPYFEIKADYKYAPDGTASMVVKHQRN